MKIGIIGLGHLGMHIAEKILIEKKHNVVVFNRSNDKSEKLKNAYNEVMIADSIQELLDNIEIVISCVPAEHQKMILKEASDREIHFVSASNGLELKLINDVYSGKISRIMPSVVEGGYTLLCTNEKDISELADLIAPLGEIIRVEEDEMDIMTVLTSCGPGLYSAVLKVIYEEARKRTEIDSTRLRTILNSTFESTLKKMEKEEKTYDNLISEVATKGGITEIGVNIINENLPDVVNKIFEESVNYNDDRKKWVSDKFK